MGPSGSGKSTLMHCLAGLDTLTSGEVFIGTTDLSTLDDKALTRLRRDQVGFVFQAYNLVPTLNASENMTLPLALGGKDPDKAWYDQVVSTVNLGDRLHHRPSELSGGQQQRRRGPRPRHATGDHLRRRADRQPRQPQQRRDPRLHAPGGHGAGPDDRHGHARPDGGVVRRPVVFLADGKIVDEMLDPTADRVLDRMKQFAD